MIYNIYAHSKSLEGLKFKNRKRSTDIQAICTRWPNLVTKICQNFIFHHDVCDATTDLDWLYKNILMQYFSSYYRILF